MDKIENLVDENLQRQVDDLNALAGIMERALMPENSFLRQNIGRLFRGGSKELDAIDLAVGAIEEFKKRINNHEADPSSNNING